MNNDKIRVLHVSLKNAYEVAGILKELNRQDAFKVEQVSFEEFAHIRWRSIGSFDVLVFGLSDSYAKNAGELPPGAASEIKKFVDSGGGIVWTHDTLCGYKDLHEMSGFRTVHGMENVGLSVPSVRIRNPEHELLQKPYRIAVSGLTVRKCVSQFNTYSHPPGGLAADRADILIDHDCPVEGPHNYYLAVHSFGTGRVVVLEIGHSAHERLGAFEKELFVNSLFWASAGTSQRTIATSSGSTVQSQAAPGRLHAMERAVIAATSCVAMAAFLMHFFPKDEILSLVGKVGVSLLAGAVSYYVLGKGSGGRQ